MASAYAAGMSDAAAPSPLTRDDPGRLWHLVRIAAVGAFLLVVADLFRWGNRWYVSTQYPDDAAYSASLELGAHQALVRALASLLVAAALALVGWRVRLTVTPR